MATCQVDTRAASGACRPLQCSAASAAPSAPALTAVLTASALTCARDKHFYFHMRVATVLQQTRQQGYCNATGRGSEL